MFDACVIFKDFDACVTSPAAQGCHHAKGTVILPASATKQHALHVYMYAYTHTYTAVPTPLCPVLLWPPRAKASTGEAGSEAIFRRGAGTGRLSCGARRVTLLRVTCWCRRDPR